MARSRNIKPGFFSNEYLAELSFATRLLFIGLWTEADREGRMEDRPKRLRMALFPADDVDVNQMLDDLAASGFIQRYEIEGKRYLQVDSFTKHQMPHHKEVASVIPAPLGRAQMTRHAYDVSTALRQAIFDRDGHECLSCRTHEKLSIDHIIPLAKGGDNSFENLQTLCTSCNSAKGDTTKDYRKTNVEPSMAQDQANKGAPCPSDSLSLDSGFLIPDSLSLDLQIEDQKPLPVAEAPAPQSNVRVIKPKSAKPKTESQIANCRTWEAYSTAYFARYGADPVRNAKVNGQVAQLVNRLGAEEAPFVAAYYVTINDSFFLRASHEFGLLVARAEGIRTQWVTGRQVNSVTARQMENTQANLSAAEQAKQMVREGGRQNAFLRR
jgi:hypothetical protein